MAQKGRSRFWRKCRIYFRRFRITVLLAILALLGIVIYLNETGLPGFIKRPLLEKLRARGMDLEFSRLRLRWYRGLVAEDVRFGQAKLRSGPRLSAREVELGLNSRALAHLQLQVDELNLHDGRLVWPVIETNTPARALTVEGIEARLRLSPGDEWTLDNFRARFAGANFFLSGTVTNASAIREWKLLRTQRTGQTAQWTERLRRLADAIEKISFSSPPELRLILEGDARAAQSFTARLVLNAPDANTPWGNATNLLLTARLFPGAGGELSHAEMILHTTRAETPWADTSDLELELHVDSVIGQTNLVDADVVARVAYAQTQWAIVTNAQFAARWIHSFTNAIPLSGDGEFRAATANTRWANGTDVRLALALSAATNPPPADASWAWWTNLQPYRVSWECELAEAKTEKLEVGRIFCAGQWLAPAFAITNLSAQLYDGGLDATAQLDVVTREAQFSVASDFDAQKISPMLTEKARLWLGKYSWVESPHLRGSGVVTLPAWTNRQPDWRAEVQPTMRLAGEFAVTNGAYLGVPADWARSHFTYTNKVWHLPDLEAASGGGQLRLTHIADDETHDYYFSVHSTIDVRALRSLLNTNQQRGFDYFKFTQPPVVDGELWGRWREHERIGFQGSIALTNFTFREQTGDSFVAQLRYTNRFLEFIKPNLWRGTQVLSAAGIAADFNTQRIHFTNGFSTTEPMVIARAIGPKTGKHLEPYRFTQPPTVRVEGYAPMKDEHDADLHFTVNGRSFEWMKFKVPHITGNVHWLGEALVLQNVRTEFYWGEAAGDASFDLSRAKPGTDFKFAVDMTNVNLQMLMTDLSTRTSRLEGHFDGRLVITNANSTDPHSWGGKGHVELHDGLIWAIPVFGVLSKPLDSVLPGLGSSRVSEGAARFIITNGVIYSETLEMRSSAMRLQYDGTVDFDGRVNARVEAEPFRDAWLVGRVLSLALWPVAKMFEYRVTGTLQEPKTEPLYIPRILQLPFHPFRTLEEWFPVDTPKTNAPPLLKEP